MCWSLLTFVHLRNTIEVKKIKIHDININDIHCIRNIVVYMKIHIGKYEELSVISYDEIRIARDHSSTMW